MKKISYLFITLLSVLTFGGCSDVEQPYVGYVTIEWRTVLDAEAGSTATVIPDTDIDYNIKVESIDFGDSETEWCTATIDGTNIIVTATESNDGTEERTATVSVRYGYWITSFIVLQKYQGQEYIQLDWSSWTATGSDVEASDGGGYSSLFTTDRTTFWHSAYSSGTVPPPHSLYIDMQEEYEVVRFDIGRRQYGENNYPSVKHMDIYVSTDNENFTKVGEFTFEIPWTAEDGTVVTGNSPLVPAEEIIELDEAVTARYVWLEITEVNITSTYNTSGVCQVSYCKVYGPI